jgi:solute carrier family 13 (sodium-dependent dicarboxylate transporter), member 2/3/5
LKYFFERYKNALALLTGLLVFVILFFLNPLHLDDKARKTLAVSALMISWWVLEALPLAVVALVPIVLFPLLGVGTMEETASSFSNPVIYLFMGGFFIGLAIEKWNLHKRIALGIVHIMGTNGNRIVLGFILATGFLSMWLSNTATTMMMFPIALSVIHVMKERAVPGANMHHFALAMMLSIAYASNFGGIATIIGTPPNVAFVGFIEKKFGYEIQFIDWMLVCMPLSILLLIILYLLLVYVLFPNRIPQSAETKAYIREELQRLGKLSKAEVSVLVVFVCTALLWIFKDLVNKTGWLKLDDTMIAVMGALGMFIMPSWRKENRGEKILEWDDTKKMAWGILLLFGGGIAMANALEKAGLIAQMGKWVAGFSGSGGLMLVFAITFVSIFLSEVMSNVAQVIVLAPVIAGIAVAMGGDAIMLGIPMTLAASCASMMPMGTPPNAIVFSSGHIKLRQMLFAGLIMNLICVALITLFSWYVLPGVIKWKI